jgi:hypothetical protein
MDPVEVVLVEYKTLRDEVVVTMSNRSAILRSGLIAIGTIFAAGGIAGRSVDERSILPGVLLMFVVPCVAICTLRLWVAEYGRMHRAGAFLGILEAKINTMAGEKPLLVWEAFLAGQGRHMTYPSTIVVLFTFISVFSAGAGIFVVSPTLTWVLVGLAVDMCALAFGVRAHHSMRDYRTKEHLLRPEDIKYRKLMNPDWTNVKWM